MNFLEKKSGKEIEEIKIDLEKYDIIFFKNKELKDLGFGEIDTNYHYIFLDNINDIENQAYNFIKEFDLSYNRNDNFINFLKSNDIIMVIDNKEIKMIDFYNSLFNEKDFKSYYQLLSKMIEELKKLKTLD